MMLLMIGTGIEKQWKRRLPLDNIAKIFPWRSKSARNRPLCRVGGRKKEGNLSSGKSKMNGGSARPPSVRARQY